MKRFKKVMAVLLAAALVLGSTMTAFAAETQNNLDPKKLDVTMEYSKDELTTDTDETQQDIYNIVISYDTLNFAYKATAITWDAANQKYVVASENTNGNKKYITVRNNSNRIVNMTPALATPSALELDSNVKYTVNLKRDTQNLGTVTNVSIENDKETVTNASIKNEQNTVTSMGIGVEDILTVEAAKVEFDESVNKFEPKKFIAVSLSFEKYEVDEGNEGDMFG